MFPTIHIICYNSVTTFLSKSNLIHLKKSLCLVYTVSSHSFIFQFLRCNNNNIVPVWVDMLGAPILTDAARTV